MKANLSGKLVVFIALAIAFAMPAQAASKKKIDRRVKEAIVEFREVVSNADKVLSRAVGVLVFPKVTKAGLGLGGEKGNGALQINGKTVEYYRTISGTIGFQAGFQVRRQMIIFFDEDTLDDFRNSENWEVGVDGSVALVTLDAGGEVDSQTFDNPAIAFVYGSKGLMYNLTLEGTKISRIHPD